MELTTTTLQLRDIRIDGGTQARSGRVHVELNMAVVF